MHYNSDTCPKAPKPSSPLSSACGWRSTMELTMALCFALASALGIFGQLRAAFRLILVGWAIDTKLLQRCFQVFLWFSKEKHSKWKACQANYPVDIYIQGRAIRRHFTPSSLPRTLLKSPKVMCSEVGSLFLSIADRIRFSCHMGDA